MIRVVNLGDNSEREVQPQEVKDLSILNVWLVIVDPTENELLTISQATQIPG